MLREIGARIASKSPESRNQGTVEDRSAHKSKSEMRHYENLDTSAKASQLAPFGLYSTGSTNIDVEI